MYYILNADQLLAAVLARRPYITFIDLMNLKTQIESACPGVAVELSSPAISGAVESYPEIFERRPGKVVRAANAERYLSTDYLKQVFTNRIPADIRPTVVATIG